MGRPQLRPEASSLGQRPFTFTLNKSYKIIHLYGVSSTTYTSLGEKYWGKKRQLYLSLHCGKIDDSYFPLWCFHIVYVESVCVPLWENKHFSASVHMGLCPENEASEVGVRCTMGNLCLGTYGADDNPALVQCKHLYIPRAQGPHCCRWCPLLCRAWLEGKQSQTAVPTSPRTNPNLASSGSGQVSFLSPAKHLIGKQ